MKEYPIEVEALIQHLCRVAYEDDALYSTKADAAKEALTVWDDNRPGGKYNPVSETVTIGKKDLAIVLGLAINGLHQSDIQEFRFHYGKGIDEAAEKLDQVLGEDFEDRTENSEIHEVLRKALDLSIS